MGWVIRVTGPNPTDNEVEHAPFAAGPWAVVGGEREWPTRPEAVAAQKLYRAAKEREVAIESGQGDLFL